MKVGTCRGAPFPEQSGRAKRRARGYFFPGRRGAPIRGITAPGPPMGYARKGLYFLRNLKGNRNVSLSRYACKSARYKRFHFRCSASLIPTTRKEACSHALRIAKTQDFVTWYCKISIAGVEFDVSARGEQQMISTRDVSLLPVVVYA